MKKIILAASILFILLTQFVQAQPPALNLPENTTIIPFRLEVGFNTTTILIFPVGIITGDRGFDDIVIQKEKEIDNVLKIKAAKKNFPPTNLHVYTTDKKIYSFIVQYTDFPNRTTFDLNKLLSDSLKNTPPILTEPILANVDLKKIADEVRKSKAFFSRKNNENEIKLQLKTIHAKQDLLVFGFSLNNYSSLDLNIDFIRLFIKDKQKSKHASIQEMEITPVYMDGLKQVEGQKKHRFVIVVPKFTIPNKKEFVVQVFEKNGGRNITLKVKNKHLLKAKSL